jgi:hypothetical protein
MADIDNEFHEIPSEGPGSGFVRNIVECCEEGGRAVVDEKLPDGSIVHSLIRLVSTNPVTDTSAIVVAVLAITENGEGTSYANIARTLASDYFNLFYVDLNTEDFVEYSSDIGSEDISFERHGENFFEASANDAKKFIYEEDVDRFVKIFTKERVVKAIDEQGSFNINYRLKTDIEPIFVTMKAVRMKGETDHIIIGVRNVDTQMRQRITLDKLKEEQMFYNRLKALMGDFVAMYTVDIPSKKYIETSSTTEYGMFGFAKTGDDFFRDTFLNVEKVIPVEELELMREAMTMENMLKTIEEEGIFVIKYHLIMNGERHLMKLRAATVEESDGKKLIVGVNFM